jgi:hypothetical protein
VHQTKNLDGFKQNSPHNGDVILNINPLAKQRIRRVNSTPHLNRKRRASILAIESDSCTFVSVFILALVVLSAVSFVIVSVGTIAVHGLSGKHEGGSAVFHYDHEKSVFQIYTVGAPSCSEPIAPENVTFTLVTQFSDDRTWMMQYHCERWQAPISVVAFTNETVANITQQLVDLGCDASQLKVQTVSASLFPPYDYPVNVLRNKALSVVETSHVMYADVDFWEAKDLLSVLQLEGTRLALAKDPQLALVVPAFQLNRQCREWRDCWEINIPMMPRSKNDLIKLLQKRQASPFDPTNPGGHGSTLYNRWFQQATDELIDIPCVRSNRYEPYLALRYCHSLPPFQEVFTGYGKNKMTFVMHLRRAGYRFQQIPSFLVHYPHLDSIARMEWNQKPQELEPVVDPQGRKVQKNPTDVQSVDWQQFKRGQVDATFVQFREWLIKTIPNTTRVPCCEDSQDDDSRLWIDRRQSSGETRDIQQISGIK